MPIARAEPMLRTWVPGWLSPSVAAMAVSCRHSCVLPTPAAPTSSVTLPDATPPRSSRSSPYSTQNNHGGSWANTDGNAVHAECRSRGPTTNVKQHPFDNSEQVHHSRHMRWVPGGHIARTSSCVARCDMEDCLIRSMSRACTLDFASSASERLQGHHFPGGGQITCTGTAICACMCM